jgi:hypothetical protein
MKRHLILGTMFSAALAVGASAQSQQPPTSQSPTSQAPTSSQDRSSSAQTITVTGCLKADTSSPSSTSPNAPANPTASSASAGYILTDATTGSSAAAASPTEQPSPTATSGTASGKTYKLTGSASDFASLVGKKVEVKGTLRGNSAAGAAAGESRPDAAMGDTSKAQQLRVTSLKEVSGSCS